MKKFFLAAMMAAGAPALASEVFPLEEIGVGTDVDQTAACGLATADVEQKLQDACTAQAAGEWYWLRTIHHDECGCVDSPEGLDCSVPAHAECVVY